MTFSINPLEGLGPIKFGMTSDKISKLIKQTPFRFKKTPDSRELTDAYFNNTLQIFYEKGKCCYIEISSKLKDTNLNNINIFSTNSEVLVEEISKISDFDKNDPELGYSYIFPKLQLSLWRNSLKSKYFSTIGIGKQRYFG